MHLLTYCKLMARISLVSKPATQKWHAYKTATSLCPEHLIFLFWQVFPLHTCVPRTPSEFKPKPMHRSCPALVELGMLGNRVHTLHCSHQAGSKIRTWQESIYSIQSSFFIWNREHIAKTKHLSLAIYTPYFASLQLSINAIFLLLPTRQPQFQKLRLK